LVDTQCIDSDETKNLKASGYSIDPNTRWLAFNLSTALYNNVSLGGETTTYPTSASFPESLLAHGCLYYISSEFRAGYPLYFLETVLNGTALGYNAVEAPDGTFFGPQVVQNMLNFGNTSAEYIGQIMDNAVTSLTNYMRENGAVGYSADAQGVPSHFATCAHVQWG
jgi:hypothetical protein